MLTLCAGGWFAVGSVPKLSVMVTATAVVVAVAAAAAAAAVALPDTTQIAAAAFPTP